MAYTTIITIKDYTTLNPLWDGQEVKILATTPLKMDSSNIVTVKPKTFQDTDLITVDDSSWTENYNRRKANLSYVSFNNHKFTIDFIYNKNIITPELSLLETTGTTVSEIKRMIFTPAKVMELVLKPRTVFIKDDIIFPLLCVNEVTPSYTKIVEEISYGHNQYIVPAIYSSKGIPVVLSSWSFVPSGKPDEIIINLTFTEDKEL